MQTVHLMLNDPIIVAQAPVDLDRAGDAWGRWQFPYLRRLSDGRLHVSFSVEPDSASSYGKPMAHAYSDDEGQTWRLGPPQVGHETEDGVLLPNGDRLQPVQRPAKRAEEYDLPDSVCDYVCTFGYPRSLYRAEDLPPELNEWRFRRLTAGKSDWVEEVADMRIPDQLRSVIKEDARGTNPENGPVQQVIKGPLPTPFLRGKIRIAPDQSLWAVTYSTRLSGKRPQSRPLFLQSVDWGHTWTCLGDVPYEGDVNVDPLADKRDGFTEPDYNFRPDGSVICLMRTSDGNGHGPLYLARSTDGARTWSRAVAFDTTFDGGKMPQLLTLDNGVTLASYGQSGGPGYIAVRATTDPAGLDWQPPVHAHFSPPAPGGWNSCGHTEMVALDDNRALIVYSDFNYRDAHGQPRKTVLVRVIETNIGEKENTPCVIRTKN
ncbi:MAG: glycoside hydrolase [Candidatus Pacebacteria bacterium]|nr:glycoside hydrolase [Candidatus Paceibacterota bacterium]